MAKLITCPTCKSDISENARSCPKCGETDLECTKAYKDRTCPKCNTPMGSICKSCPKCGETDFIYISGHKYIEVECYKCNGMGRTHRDYPMYSCENCNGTGVASEKRPQYLDSRKLMDAIDQIVEN